MSRCYSCGLDIGSKYIARISDKVLHGNRVRRGVDGGGVEAVRRPVHHMPPLRILGKDEGVELAWRAVADSRGGHAAAHVNEPANRLQTVEQQPACGFEIEKRSVHGYTHVAGPIAARSVCPLTKVCTVSPPGAGFTGLALIKFAGQVKAWPPTAS